MQRQRNQNLRGYSLFIRCMSQNERKTTSLCWFMSFIEHATIDAYPQEKETPNCTPSVSAADSDAPQSSQVVRYPVALTKMPSYECSLQEYTSPDYGLS